MSSEVTDLEARVVALQEALALERQRRQQLEIALQESGWQAEAAERAKASLMGNLTHELHTPLSAILGFTALLREDVLRGEYDTAVRDLDKIEEASRTLLRHIDELLGLANIEADTMGVTLTRFAPAVMIARVMTQFEEGFVAQGNRLRVEVGTAVVEVVADEVKVRQVLAHLLDNANKFTVAGEVLVRVSAVAREGRDGVRFEVRDTGQGMVRRKVARVLTAFARSDRAPTEQVDGLGLGLHLCQQLCGLMGGEMGIESVLGKGTVAWFWLPDGG